MGSGKGWNMYMMYWRYLSTFCICLFDFNLLILHFRLSSVPVDFHREQVRLRWLSSVSNGMRDNKELVLPMLRKIASSESKEENLKNAGELKSSDLWNNEKAKPFRDWIEKIWLSAYTVSFEFLYQFRQTLYPKFDSVQL